VLWACAAAPGITAISAADAILCEKIMTRDLFGDRGVVSRESKPARERSVIARHTGLDAGALPAVMQRYYQVNNHSYTRDEVYAMVDFHQACKDSPDDDIIVVLDCARPQAYVYMVLLPRNHPSRLDHLGRQDPAKQPPWRHGEIMHIQRVGPMP
jgi:hypothetical protein